MDTIIVLDFGSQYCHLISRRLRDLGVYSEVLPAATPVDTLQAIPELKGVILSGGAASVYDSDAPAADPELLLIGVPILGICYGHQLIAHLDEGKVTAGTAGEYGLTSLTVQRPGKLLEGVGPTINVWMNHGDIVESLPSDYTVTATTADAPVAAFENTKRGLYGTQFHPEVAHTEKGAEMLANFVFDICQARAEWSPDSAMAAITAEIEQAIGGKKAIIGLSGGIDSSVAALLVNRVLGKKLVAVYVDTGLMRYRETELLKETFAPYHLNLRVIDASARFFAGLKGVTDPEEKRKIIGRLFIEVFDEVAAIEKADVLIQGTIYSDRIESGATKHSSTIKSHHNVGGLPKDMKLTVYEPLRELYKDEVRRVAAELGMPKSITGRQVFPGPGNAIRIIGEVTPEKAEIVRQATHIIEETLKEHNLYDRVWMSFAVLLSIKSVGIQGDARSYKYPIVVRIVESQDAMTANFADIPHAVLEQISTRITNQIKAVNRVVYDISNKPPATMEWE
ncbi:glutamine-hydrolyzing GMP synthase [Patescibacteria group bacterium]|nr:glutamine-hydrolyzing GMP synthase [Patescibacteria group bacterium]